jgi:hypothetical protein
MNETRCGVSFQFRVCSVWESVKRGREPEVEE